MKKRWRLILKILLVLVLVSGVLCAGIRQLEYYRSAQEQADAEQIASVPDSEPDEVPETEEETYTDPYAGELASIDLEALREVNDDIIGWISIPGTQVSYPLLQSVDNSYYLKHTWKEAYNSAGSIFLECRNAPDLSDFNTIIYGHNMRNGSMFGELKQYRDLEYWKEHPSVYIVNDSGVHRYDIFAAHEAGVRTIIYGLGITEQDTKERFIELAQTSSVIEPGVVPTVEDKIVTLSTCTGNGYDTRWVVQGVLNDGKPAWLQE